MNLNFTNLNLRNGNIINLMILKTLHRLHSALKQQPFPDTICILIQRIFQSTYPHKMRLDRKNKIALSSIFQSPHLHKMRPEALRNSIKAISIHTSVQNATKRPMRTSSAMIFQSTHSHRMRRQ